MLTHTRAGIVAPRRGDDDLAGSTLAGRYAVLELLGAGGMGTVYRAHDRELDELIALKVIRADHVGRPGMVEQFRHEVKLARRVTHVNIARTFELAVADGVVFCTMELVEGESLRRRVEREGAMTIAEAVAVITAVCDGLAVAHAAGVIHRDIKPDNVLLTPTGRVVLADFGVAALGSADADGSLVGTLEYMAPEQARGEQATAATDVYAVGVMLFEMLTGLRAFSGSMSELIVAKQDRERLRLEFAESVTREPIPAELQDIVGKATARDPVDRIGAAAELARQIAPWRAALASVTGPAAGGRALDGPHTEGKRLPPSLAIVVVLAPRGNAERIHIAQGVHQELLRRLAARRLRVLPRVDAVDTPNGTTVELIAAQQLSVVVRRAGMSSSLSLPLDVGSIGFAADAIAAAVVEVVERRVDVEANEKLELLLEARRYSQDGFQGIRPAAEILKTANERWPKDPRFACELAGLLLRFGFSKELREAFPDARSLVATALAGTPEVAESHLAAAHLDLHDGDPVLAARAFRRAIAISPYQAEGHEGLGRMLLEAGYLDDAMSRIDDALAIAPQLSSVKWEIARAHALESNWMVHDQLVGAMTEKHDRPIARVRFAIWRRDRERMLIARDAWTRFPVPFELGFMELVFHAVIEDTWEYGERLLELAQNSESQSKRRRAFLAQVAAEVAGHFGDTQACLRMVTFAVEHQLFDRHWLDLCPPIAAARATPEGQVLQATVARRAEAILDALYGDHGASDTVMETADTMLPRSAARRPIE